MCFDDPEGLNNEHLPSWCSPQLCELANGLRLATIVLKSRSEWSLGESQQGQYLSIRPNRGYCPPGLVVPRDFPG
jgi:hypothetical protein